MQFYVSNTRPSADGETITATIIDRDLNRLHLLDFPADIKIIGEDEDGNPIVRCPKERVRFGNITVRVVKREHEKAGNTLRFAALFMP